MKKLQDYIENEPVRILAFVQLVVGILVALNVISAEAAGGIITATSIYLGVSVRDKVTPVATLAGKIQSTLAAGDTRTGEDIVSEIFDGDV